MARKRSNERSAPGRGGFTREELDAGAVSEAVQPAGREGGSPCCSRRRLVIRHQGETIATHPFPIPEPPVDPYYPTAHRGLYHHTMSTMS